MLGAELWDFDAAVAGIDDLLVDAEDLVSEDDGYLVARVEACAHLLECEGVMRLFDGIDGEALAAELVDGVERVRVIVPSDGLFGSEGGLVYLVVGGAAAYAAEGDAV